MNLGMCFVSMIGGSDLILMNTGISFGLYILQFKLNLTSGNKKLSN